MKEEIKMKKDFYTELDKIIAEHENFHPRPTRSLDWVADRIAWCHQWKKITENQTTELAARVTELFMRR